MRTLIVDDSRLDRLLISRLLKSSDESIEIMEAQDAIEAFDAVTVESFDCLLVDQRMPGIIGTEFIRAFRDIECGVRTPIVVVSGDQEDLLTPEEALGAGGDFFLAKRDLTASRLKAALACLDRGR